MAVRRRLWLLWSHYTQCSGGRIDLIMQCRIGGRAVTHLIRKQMAVFIHTLHLLKKN